MTEVTAMQDKTTQSGDTNDSLGRIVGVDQREGDGRSDRRIQGASVSDFVTRNGGHGIALPVPSSHGLSQPVEIRGGGSSDAAFTVPASPPSNKVIGVVCSGDVAVHRDQVKSALERGKEQRPDAVWVCFESKSDRMTRDLMLSLDMDPVVLPLNEEWRSKDEEHGYDLRRTWRDLELLHLCDEVIVFHKRTGNSPWRDRAKDERYAGKLYVVELGKEKTRAKARKTRTPVGA